MSVEMAMYFRYAQKAAYARSVQDAWKAFSNDTRIQYPEHINAFNQYNVIPGILQNN